MELSPQEKQELAKKLRKELVQQKASELGVSVDDLMLRVTDGRMNFVHKAKVYSDLEKQRQLAGPPKMIRALRGEDSLINRIGQELTLLLKLIEGPLVEEFLSALERSDYRTNLGKIKNRKDSLAKSLTEVEDRIERAKTEDKVFKEGEAVLLSLSKAKEANDASKIAEITNTHKDLIIAYTARRKGLDPYFTTARELRLELQREYWRILSLRWKLDSSFVVYARKFLKTCLDQNESGLDKSELEVLLTEILQEWTILNKNQIELAGRCPPRHIDIQLASGAFDAIIPDMKILADDQSELIKQLSNLVNLQKKKDIPSSSRVTVVGSKGK